MDRLNYLYDTDELFALSLQAGLSYDEKPNQPAVKKDEPFVLPRWRAVLVLLWFFLFDQDALELFAQAILNLVREIYPVIWLWSDSYKTLTIIYTIMTITSFFVIGWLCLPLFRYEYQNRKRNWRQVFRWLFVFYGVYFVLNYFSNIFIMGSVSINQQVVVSCLLTNPFWMSLILIFFGPFVEEMTFRVALAGSFFRKHPIFSFLFSTFLFALLHVWTEFTHGQWYQLSAIVGYFYDGLLIMGIYRLTKTAAAPVLLHMLFNATATIAVLARYVW